MKISTFIYATIAALGAAGVGLATSQLIQQKAGTAAPQTASSTKTSTTPPAAKPNISRSTPATGSVTVLDIKEKKMPIRPDFSLPDLDDKKRSISEFNGKVIVLNFWASWCPPCVKEMPAFVRLQEKYGAQGVQVIGIAIDQKQLAMDFADRVSVNYPIMYGGLDAIEIGKAYGNIRGQLPYTVFITRDRRLFAVKQGEITEKEMEAYIKPFLNAPGDKQTVIHSSQ